MGLCTVQRQGQKDIDIFQVWVTPRQKPGAQHSVLLSPVGVRAPALEDSFAASQDVRLQAVG